MVSEKKQETELGQIGYSFGDNKFYMFYDLNKPIKKGSILINRVATHEEIYRYLLDQREKAVSHFWKELENLYYKKYGDN